MGQGHKIHCGVFLGLKSQLNLACQLNFPKHYRPTGDVPKRIMCQIPRLALMVQSAYHMTKTHPHHDSSLEDGRRLNCASTRLFNHTMFRIFPTFLKSRDDVIYVTENYQHLNIVMFQKSQQIVRVS